jgi:DNA ligase-associated metallophosphoesterase
MSEPVTLTIAGQTLQLLPDRAVIWLERRTLIVADTHFGKSAFLREHGMAVPAGSDQHDRERLNRLLEHTGAARLIILGDFLHGPIDPQGDDVRALEAWLGSLRDIEVIIIEGNHDRGARKRWRPPADWREGDHLEPPFLFTHDRRPEEGDLHGADGPFTLSGHIHPVVRLRGLRKHGARLPVFWRHAGGLVLPSFGSFTGGFLVAPQPGDRLFVAAPERVVPF